MATGTETPVLVERCTGALSDLGALARSRSSHWLTLDMTMGQLKAIVVLSDRGPLSVGGLARALAIAEPAASTLVDKLVDRGLAAREADAADRRRTLVAATEEGRSLTDRLRTIHDERMTEWLGHLDPEELAGLLRGLEALVRIASATGDPEDAPERGIND